MSSLPSPQHDSDSVREFFEQWQIYKKVVDANYMRHREAYAAIASALPSTAFSFLDLGSGDACWTSRLLENRPLNRYQAIDLSQPALELARANTVGLSGGKTFIQGDFVLKLPEQTFDVVFTGMSLHHLPLEEKREFLPRIRRFLNSGGRFIFFEVIRGETETREQVLARWWDYVSLHWTNLSAAELGKIQEHVFSSDYQEPVSGYLELAITSGFATAKHLYTDENGFYAVIACET